VKIERTVYEAFERLFLTIHSQFATIDTLTAENMRLRGLGECICPNCGLRHGGCTDGETEF